MKRGRGKGGEALVVFSVARTKPMRFALRSRQFRETILTPRVVHSITILLSTRRRFKFAPSRVVVTDTFLRFPFFVLI